MYAKAVNFRESIVIYYEHERKNLRLATGVTKIENDSKYFKDGKLTAKVPDHENKNNTINIKLQQVNDVIKDFFFANKIKPAVDFVKTALKQEKRVLKIAEKKYECFEDYYILMFEEKKQEAIAPSSLKDYTSALNSLKLYQHLNGKLTLDSLNSEEFLKKLESFLAKKHNNINLKEFKTNGNLNVNTTRKRISTVLTFLKWCEKKGLIKRKFEVENYQTKLKRYQPTVVIITREEKESFLKLKLKGAEKKLRDIMVFLCLTGLRYSDLLTLHPGFFQNGYITKEAEKTKLKFKIPLTNKAREIAEKYNYKLNFFSTTMFNRLIKELLKKYNICCNTITIKNVVFNKVDYMDVIKYTQISSHTGRRSFIANCIMTGHGIPEIMAMTGHTKITSLQCYIDQFQSQNDAEQKIQLLD
jgi:integrase